MPLPADLFLGLVTHPLSRFADAISETGLVRSVAREALGAGLTVELGVSDRDEWSPALVEITAIEVRASVDAELELEGRWRAYVAGTSLGLGSRAVLATRRVRRRMRYAPPWRRSLDPEGEGPRMVRRLANIELSHLRIMRDAVASQARWCLIVEDDASSGDPARFTRELAAVIRVADASGQPLTMNVSESFTPEQLGITALLRPRDSASGDLPWRLFAAERPVTNTVCAVLYRRDYLERLVSELEAIPLSPVVPIDFKVNEAVMRLAPDMNPGDCWVASPAPLEQRSGVPQVGRS